MAWRQLALVLSLIASSSRLADCKREVFEVFHRGHQATHVTRLHRYEHSGLAAMLEAEARWHGLGNNLPAEASSVPGVLGKASAAATLSAASARAHAAAREAKATGSRSAVGGRRFVPLSQQQAAALREHHRQVLLEVGSAANATSAISRLRTIKYHGQRTPGDGSPAVTGLSSLDSQYVGPIGVGTVLSPEGCRPSDGRSLIYLPPGAERGPSSEVEGRACHVQDQSRVWVVFDTGSTNIWVDSDLCRSGPCSRPGRRQYDHTKSSTYSSPQDGVVLNIEFGTGKISGPQAIDDFHIGPFTVYNQTFGMIEVQDGHVFEEVPFEGILGLAFPKMSANGVRPFFDNIIDQKALGQNEFAFYFSLDSPAANAVFWGGVDPKFYSGPIEYFHVDDPYYWSVPLLAFRIGDKELLPLLGERGSGKGYKAIVDTGTTFFTAQGRLFPEIMRRLPATSCDRMTAATHPPITFRLLNSAGQPRDFVLNSSQYMTSGVGVGSDDASQGGYCSPAFMKITVPPEHGPAMVLGEVFLRHYFSVFDRGDGAESHARVGFARASHGDGTLRRLKTLTHDQPAFTEGQAI